MTEVPLPSEIQDELAEIAFREASTEFRGRRLDELIARHPEYAVALRAFAAGVSDLPQSIGPFRILALLGEGGFGRVYRAQQTQGVDRIVALKVLRRDVDSRAVLARFELERQVLGAMSHDSIARFYESGEADGQLWFSMELVEGQPLTSYCDERRLTISERLRLFLKVCDGVQHAHGKGIVHRDLKPANVLVIGHENGHAAKIIDFGIARATDHHLSQSMQTMLGMVLGTPEYMAPEQCGGDPIHIDARTDVYALGVMLYELVSGRLPFDSTELPRNDLVTVQNVLLKKDPPKPSTRIATLGADGSDLAKMRQVSPTGWRRAVAGDLDAIVGRAMEKDQARRYQSIADFASDLRRHLGHEPIVARPPSKGYQLKKLVRKYRGQVMATAALLLVTLTGAATIVWFAIDLDNKVRDFEQLAAVVLYETLVAEEKLLHPPLPHRVDAMEGWLRQARTLFGMKGALQATVASLSATASPERVRANPSGVEFDTKSRAFLGETLSSLLEKMQDLETRVKPAVEARLRWASSITALSLQHPKARCSWPEVRSALAANARYAAHRAEVERLDSTGLVPIGENPKTGLWEFYDLLSAWDRRSDPGSIEIPQHDPVTGAIPLGDATGIIFVLVPGGTFMMGAQRTDRGAPNHDPLAEPDEAPHVVTLGPFLLARHELTQGQWARLWNGDEAMRWPSFYRVGAKYDGIPLLVGASHPVESVTWDMCDTMLREAGLSLPTEAQWEFAARAGTSTPWYTGDSPLTLQGHANVLDETAHGLFPAWGIADAFEDGFAQAAPVASFGGTNSFGLYDVHGNVSEWCEDHFADYAVPCRRGDGLRLAVESATDRCIRGGPFLFPSALSRSAVRTRSKPSAQGNDLGLRAARGLSM